MEKITAIGVFDDPSKAAEAIEALRAAGFSNDDLGVIARQAESSSQIEEMNLADPRSSGTHPLLGIEIGAATGGVAGLGFGMALAAGLVPGIGPVVAGGTLAVLMAGTGVAAGSLLGGYLGTVVPQQEANLARANLAAGHILVTVHAGKRYEEALGILAQHGARQSTMDVGRRS